MPLQAADFETKSYAANARSYIKLKSTTPIAGLDMRQTIDYDTGTSVTRYKDGYATQLISTIQVLGGAQQDASGDLIHEFIGDDLHRIYEFLEKEAHGFTQVSDTASQSGLTVGGNRWALPLHLPPGEYKVRVLWGGASNLGSGYTINSSYIYGNVHYAQRPLPPFRTRVVQETGKSGSGVHTEIPFLNAALKYILVLLRANASPYAPRDPSSSTIEVRVNNETKYNTSWEEAQTYYKAQTNLSSLQTGVGLLKLDPPIVPRGESKVVFNLDSTSTDITLYYFYDTLGKVSIPTTASPQFEPIGAGMAAGTGLIGGRVNIANLRKPRINLFRRA